MGTVPELALESARTQCAVDPQGLSEFSKRKLSIAGIFHAHFPEKDNTGGRVTASCIPLRTGCSSGNNGPNHEKLLGSRDSSLGGSDIKCVRENNQEEEDRRQNQMPRASPR
jgi:hypothetical protein